MTTFWTIFRRFPKILQKLSEGQAIVSEHFRGQPKISEEEPIMFRSYRKTSKCFLRLYVTIAMLIFSLLKITCDVHEWRYHDQVCARKLAWFFTGVYIIKFVAVLLTRLLTGGRMSFSRRTPAKVGSNLKTIRTPNLFRKIAIAQNVRRCFSFLWSH